LQVKKYFEHFFVMVCFASQNILQVEHNEMINLPRLNMDMRRPTCHGT